MRNLGDLRLFYERELAGKLESLEKLRRELRKDYLIFIGGLIAAFLTMVFGGIGLGRWSVVVGIAMIVGLIVFMIKVNQKQRIYREVFKEKVVTQIVRMINPDWEYRYDQCIDKATYFASELFRHRVDRYRGDDLVKGKIEKTDFCFSELHSEYKTVTTDSKGRRREQWHTLFRGIFFHAEFNKHLRGKTFVLPDRAEKFFGTFGQRFQKNKNRGELVKMENPEFEKEFVVHGSDQIEPRYVLTPKMMERMLILKKKYKTDLHFSFIQARMYCAMSVPKSLFEPRIFSSGVRFEDVEEMHDLFGLIEVIVHEMELNTRIWTKV